MWAWPGSRDHDNCTVQTAAMGQIPRSTERIPVLNALQLFIVFHGRVFAGCITFLFLVKLYVGTVQHMFAHILHLDTYLLIVATIV